MAPQGPAPEFIDWWFTPWRAGGPALPSICQSELARHDVYRHWCAEAGVTPNLPAQADWRWQAAAALDAASLVTAAELFGGLLAARAQRHEELALLAPAPRRWCLAVALTQPLCDWGAAPGAHGAPGARGLLELGLRAERALPGLWARLALLLPEPARPRLAGALDSTPALRERDRRCWLMCAARALQISAEHTPQEPA